MVKLSGKLFLLFIIYCYYYYLLIFPCKCVDHDVIKGILFACFLLLRYNRCYLFRDSNVSLLS